MSSRLAPLSSTEVQSVVSALMSGVRLDGRGLLDNRDCKVHFGKDFGSCHVSLGETRVLAQITCEVVEPKSSRPNEGRLVISVHISPMAGPEYEAGRTIEMQDELQQLLENNIRESRCLDVEALCIMAEESVWLLRADVTVLNACGNLGDACNMAIVGALKHFHRPDVTVEEDGRVLIHSFAERAPIPTFLKKVPVCLTYAFCKTPSSEEQTDTEDELLILADPTNLEERVVLGRLVVGLNPHGEITSMNFPGLLMLQKKHVMFCIKNAFERAKHCAALLERVVQDDLESRKQQLHPAGFVGKLCSDEAQKRRGFDEKVSIMKTMSNQLQQMRQLFGGAEHPNEGGGATNEEEEGMDVEDEEEQRGGDENLQKESEIKSKKKHNKKKNNNKLRKIFKDNSNTNDKNYGRKGSAGVIGGGSEEEESVSSESEFEEFVDRVNVSKRSDRVKVEDNSEDSEEESKGLLEGNKL